MARPIARIYHPTDPEGIALHQPDAAQLHVDDAGGPGPAELADRAETAVGAYLAARAPDMARDVDRQARLYREEEGPAAVAELLAAALEEAHARPARPGDDPHTLARLHRRACLAVSIVSRVAHGAPIGRAELARLEAAYR
jgi:hypothetical protein